MHRPDVKYPDIKVKLSGADGNAVWIIESAAQKMRRAGVPEAELEEFGNEARSGDYDHVIQTVMRWVDVS